MIPFRKLLVFLILACFLVGCGSETSPTDPSEVPAESSPVEPVDFAASLKLDLSSDTAKQEVTVKTFVDGDTVHFNVPTDVLPDGVLKARFLAINTPESTGKIEEYGKTASEFTRERLSAAASILVESDNSGWNMDSTGDRHLVWVWYKTTEAGEYRNLNVEILQNGLARANSASDNRYGSTCLSAVEQARKLELNIYSGQKDPNYYYGDAVELTLKELRTNIEAYSGMKVAFNGVITTNSGNQGVYVEDLDPESGYYCGMYLYYGHGLNGTGLDILSVGNEVRIVGTVQYYEGGGTWQVSDLNYRMMVPDDPNNIQKISGGHSPAYTPVSPETFTSQVTVPNGEGELTAPWAQLALGTSVEMQDLTVVDAYTSDDGAITLTCVQEEYTITIRTVPMRDAEGKLITQEKYLGQTLDVKGIVDYFDGGYQIKVFSAKNITIH